MTPLRFALTALALLLTSASIYFFSARSSPWTPAEIETLRSLSLTALPPLPPDPTNHVADDPRAAELGHRLFFDARFSGDGTVSCASCHMPELNFQDARAHGRGIAETRRRTESIVGSAYFSWFFWDGRRDSLWSQALAPLESANEHGGDRAQYARLIAQNYREAYAALFGPLPDLQEIPAHASPAGNGAARAAWDKLTSVQQHDLSHIYANMGKAIAAYERKLLPGASRFDQYVDAVTRGDVQRANEIFSADEVEGLRLYIGKADCAQCHNTPLLSDGNFHNTGVPQHAETEHDLGRAEGAQNLKNEFDCASEYSDSAKADCPTLPDSPTPARDMVGAFKTPSLRKTQFVAPFMHNAWYTSLREVLDHYNRAPAAMIGQTELRPLDLDETELKQLEAFLLTLTAPVNAPPQFLAP